MKNILFYSITVFLFFLFTNTTEANLAIPGHSGGFVPSLNVLFLSYSALVFLLPVMIGLMLPRKFVIVWHFVTLLSVMLLVAFFFKSGILIDISRGIFFATLLLAFLYTSFFTIIAYTFSTIGSTFERIKEVQKILNHVKDRIKIVLMFLIYLLPVTPMIYVSENNPVSYARNPIILAGIITSLLIILISIIWLYVKRNSLPKKDISNQKRDHLYFIPVVLIFVISFLLVSKFYPKIDPLPPRPLKVPSFVLEDPNLSPPPILLMQDVKVVVEAVDQRSG